jgi:hypothetical protein
VLSAKDTTSGAILWREVLPSERIVDVVAGNNLIFTSSRLVGETESVKISAWVAATGHLFWEMDAPVRASPVNAKPVPDHLIGNHDLVLDQSNNRLTVLIYNQVVFVSNLQDTRPTVWSWAPSESSNSDSRGLILSSLITTITASQSSTGANQVAVGCMTNDNYICSKVATIAIDITAKSVSVEVQSTLAMSGSAAVSGPGRLRVVGSTIFSIKQEGSDATAYVLDSKTKKASTSNLLSNLGQPEQLVVQSHVLTTSSAATIPAVSICSVRAGPCRIFTRATDVFLEQTNVACGGSSNSRVVIGRQRSAEAASVTNALACISSSLSRDPQGYEQTEVSLQVTRSEEDGGLSIVNEFSTILAYSNLPVISHVGILVRNKQGTISDALIQFTSGFTLFARSASDTIDRRGGKGSQSKKKTDIVLWSSEEAIASIEQSVLVDDVDFWFSSRRSSHTNDCVKGICPADSLLHRTVSMPGLQERLQLQVEELKVRGLNKSRLLA